MYPEAKYQESQHLLMLPLPSGKRMGEPVTDDEFLEWLRGVFLSLFDAKPDDDVVPEEGTEG
jgi:hypothetical protein